MVDLCAGCPRPLCLAREHSGVGKCHPAGRRVDRCSDHRARGSPLPPVPPAMASSSGSFQTAKAQVIAEFEQTYITELLRVHQGNVTHAARAAHMERRAFGRLIKKYLIAKY